MTEYDGEHSTFPPNSLKEFCDKWFSLSLGSMNDSDRKEFVEDLKISLGKDINKFIDYAWPEARLLSPEDIDNLFESVRINYE